jgi:FAD dependent oxidoreductase
MNDLHYFRKDWIVPTQEKLDVDVCIYGATSGGVIAAIEAVERGKSVALLQPGKFIGGLTTGGLGETDFGHQAVIGGKSREFYHRVGGHYGVKEEWHFEPHVATGVFDAWLKSAGVEPIFCQYLDSVQMVQGRIASIWMLGGLQVSARMFIDATYEGDLLAKAKVPYHVGRESNSTYGETINGIQIRKTHQFVDSQVDPYVRAGDPSSGLLPHVEAIDQASHPGEGDTRVQAYCFRICMTDDPTLRIPWQKPAGFKPLEYMIAERWYAQKQDIYNDSLSEDRAARELAPQKFDRLTHPTAGGFHKTDTNNHGPISSDYIGMSWDWPDGCYETREDLFQQHVTYQQGFYWFMANSENVPERYRKAYSNWGLCKDEFVSTGGWSHTLYVREGRRMISDYVMSEQDCMGKRRCEDPVGMGSYALDSHNCTRFINHDGMVMNDGDVQISPPRPYGISYRSIVPSRASVQNLLVPVCCSTSHIAYGSVRMEPVFMILGQSAAIAACLAIDAKTSVQDVPYAKLRRLLDAVGQKLSVQGK